MTRSTGLRSSTTFWVHVAFCLVTFGGGCGFLTVLAFCCGR